MNRIALLATFLLIGADITMAENQSVSGKNFAIAAAEIKPIATGYGAAFASDHILVDGKRVGYMYREAPEFSEDGGWRFLSGEETQEYMDNSDNSGLYDTNTVANYDPEIIPFLQYPVGTEIARNQKTGKLQVIEHID